MVVHCLFKQRSLEKRWHCHLCRRVSSASLSVFRKRISKVDTAVSFQTSVEPAAVNIVQVVHINPSTACDSQCTRNSLTLHDLKPLPLIHRQPSTQTTSGIPIGFNHLDHSNLLDLCQPTLTTRDKRGLIAEKAQTLNPTSPPQSFELRELEQRYRMGKVA